MKIDFHIINNKIELFNIKGEWNELINEMESKENFYRFEWIWSYLSTYNVDDFCICVGKVMNKIICIFPVRILDKNGKTIEFITSSETDYNTLYINRNYNKYYIIQKWVEYLNGIYKINKWYLRNFPDSDELGALSDILNKKGYITWRDKTDICSRYMTKYPLKAEKERVRSISKHYRQLEKQFSLNFHIENGASDEIIDFIVDRKNNQFLNSEYNSLYKQFLKTYSVLEKDNIITISMTLDGKVAAAGIAFVNENKLNFYLIAYEEKYKNYGPGLVLIKKLLESDKYDVVDFLRGNENYKFFWSDNICALNSFYAYKRGPVGFIKLFRIQLRKLLTCW